MTFLELCQRLRQEVGAAGTGPASVTGQNGEYARLIDWVRQAWREIQSERRGWRFDWAEGSVELTADFRDYSLPADFDRWVDDSLYIGDDRLRVLDYDDFRQRFREPADEQTISAATILPDMTLRLSRAPTADATLAFEYYRAPQELANASDVPRMPARFHMLIVYRAMMQYGLYEEAPVVVQQGNSNASRMIDDLMQSELGRIEMPEALA